METELDLVIKLLNEIPKPQKTLLPLINVRNEEKKSTLTEKPKVKVLKATNKTIRCFRFRPFIDSLALPTDQGYYYKVTGEVQLVRNTLQDNGFIEGTSNISLLWVSGPAQMSVFHKLEAFCKINQFPKSVIITRKDLLYRNLTRLAAIKRFKTDFLPETFILPTELSFLKEHIDKFGGRFIVKPRGSSQGKGIFLANSVKEIPAMENYVVSKYIPNPLLVNGLKFDLRIYVLVTSINPLKIYMYQDGLTRFATEKYGKTSKLAHLTNYSLNKFNKKYESNPFIDTESGSKWSLLGLKQYFESNKMDWEKVDKIMKDIVIKTIISAESTLRSAMETNLPTKDSCFQLFGFDILLDDTLQPWLLEVNLSPSLSTDSPVDVKVKNKMIAETLTLARILTKSSREIDLFTKPDELDQKVMTEYKRIKKGETLKITKRLREQVFALEEETRLAENWERIFPTKESLKYRKLFEEETEMNLYFMLREYLNGEDQVEL